MKSCEQTPLKMLVVEDNVELLTILARSVSRLRPNLEIDWATNLSEARHSLRSDRYDAILVDYVLDRDARGTALYADSRRSQPGTPFAIMSSRPLDELVRCVKDPAIPLLTKPFTSRDLAVFISALLEDHDGAVAETAGANSSRDADRAA